MEIWYQAANTLKDKVECESKAINVYSNLIPAGQC